MSEWQSTKLGDVLTLNYGKALKAENRIFGEFPVYSSAGLTGYHNEPLVKSQGLIVGRKGTVGKVYISKVPFCCIDTAYFVLPNETKYSLDYFYYLLQTLGLEELNEDSAVPGLNRETAYQQEFRLPSVPEQKAIAAVLSSLDDKIDLLHRQNTTLEAMAKTLFRQWFEEELQDSNIGQLINLQNGYAFKSVDFKDFGEHQVLKIKNISGGIIDVNKTDFLDSSVGNKTDEKFKVGSGDILFAMTGAELGKLGIVPKTKASLWLNQRVGLLKEKYKGARFLAYLQLTSDIGQDYIENSATGSAQPNISGSLIEQCPFPKIEPHLIKERAETLDVYYQKLISNLGQIQILEKLRDNLLPKLISGEIRVV